MSQEQIAGIVRHFLSGIGAVLAAKGVVDESGVQLLIGAGVAVVGVIWSFVSKKKPVE